MNNGMMIVIVLGASAVSVAITWILVAKLYARKLEDNKSLKSIQKTIEDGQKTYAALQKVYEETANSLNRCKHDLSIVEGRTKELVELEGRAKQIHDLLNNGDNRLEALKAEIEQKTADGEAMAGEIQQLKSELDLYSRLMDFVDFGIYEEPEYLHETSERYKVEIKRVRDEQKKLIKDKKAIDLPKDIDVEGSSQKGSSILAGQAKMMLRAFNLECDVLIEKVNPSSFDRTLERIEKAADTLENTAISLMCGISTKYVELKFTECRLYYEYKVKKAEEQEEQRLIREQMREEEKARREYERAVAEAEKEERMYEQLLAKARESFHDAEGNARVELEAKIQLLEAQLEEAHEKEARAKSMAEQTRRGHVYIISNIGSFGDEVYKIGLTRRLEPLDRVKELGDASVPFPFDVHAIIYNDDAPAMEASLHKKFTHSRVNVVNRRKEFFRVSLDDIRSAVDEISDNEVDFRMTALAEEYHESRRLLGSGSDETTSPTLTQETV